MPVKDKTKEMVTRSYQAEVRAENSQEGNIIIGRPIVYDTKTDLGWFDEVIVKGALDKADLEDVLFFVNHDINKIPLARSRRNNENSTMKLKVDDKGLEIKAELDVENNTEAKNLYSAIKRGDITGMSFMFQIDSERWEDLESEHPTRFVEKISIVREVSAVCFPAYPTTEINARDKVALDNAKRVLDNTRAELDNSKKDALALEKEKIKYLYGGM